MQKTIDLLLLLCYTYNVRWKRMKKLQEIISLIKLAFDKNDYVKKIKNM